MRGKRGRYHHGDLRRTLLEAAVVVLAKEGVEGLTLREVARRAGVSHAAPYRHFADKEAILAAVAEEGFRRFRQTLLEAADEAGADALARWRGMALGYLRFATQHPHHFRLMFSARWAGTVRHVELQEAGNSAFAVLVEGVRAAQASGGLRTTDPLEASIASWSMVHGAAILYLDSQLSHTLQAGGAQLPDVGRVEALARLVSGTLELGLGRR